MKTKAILFCLGIAAVVAGCAAPGPKPVMVQSKNCGEQSCNLVVFVSGDIAAGTPTVVVDYPELRIVRGNTDAEIVWVLQARGYEFRRESITPKPGSPNAGSWDSQFAYVSNSKTTYVLHNKNTNTLTYDYTITVWNTRLNQMIKLDPAIFNEGP